MKLWKTRPHGRLFRWRANAGTDLCCFFTFLCQSVIRVSTVHSLVVVEMQKRVVIWLLWPGAVFDKSPAIHDVANILMAR
jgi:hypothetical protein